MKVYKLEVMIIDHDEVGLSETIATLENANFPNDCIAPKVMSADEREIGEWMDENPLNRKETQKDFFNQLFK